MKMAINMPVSQASAVTVLTAFSHITVKRFQIEESGVLTCIPYGQESNFYHSILPVTNIVELGSLVQRFSLTPNTVLIRGTATPGLAAPIRRRAENFPEHASGCPWLMIDFDNLQLPNGMNPGSRDAIEHVIRKLPAEFHNVSYYYQFSASAGILNSDGSPLKTGLNVHLFFWLHRNVHGKSLAAYLERHCIRTEFYTKTFDQSGAPFIRFGIDPAVLRSSVQPHYIGLPILGTGVNSSLAADARQGLVSKQSASVLLPEFEADLLEKASTERKKLRAAYKVECGFVEARLVTRASHGAIAVSSYYRKTDGVSPSTNRTLAGVESYGADGNAIILYFDDENSPGSWYVRKASPQLARRFGDGDTIPLKELSDMAYAHVRDTEKWFTDITQHDALPLTAEGFLPDIQSFATARNVLIEAPTGSGKTTAFCRFAVAHPKSIILYAAQTRALVRQMQNDLARRNVRVVHYKDFPAGGHIEAAVYVTTNESLGKFVDAATKQGLDYVLVVDEVHTALDDFMASDRKNQLLERAISRSQRGLFMTATISPLQITKLVDTISRVCGALTPEMFASYRFAPVKSNPLILQQVGQLGEKFVALLRHYATLKAAGERIPRTVMITPTSKMRVFIKLLEHFGLLDQSHVVSRQENTPAAVEEARTSVKPILISSPMFALGLNFEVEPERFWTYFSYLPVDSSAIIQTLNRANRGSIPCEVRLFHGELNEHPIWIPSAVSERLKIQGYLLDETSVQGMLDSHLHVDRPTYNALRKAEKHTAKSMGNLLGGDLVQNYHIDGEWEETLVVDKADAETFKSFKDMARESYLDDIEEQAFLYHDESEPFLLHKLELLYQEEQYLDRVTNGRVARDIETEERAIVMRLCGIEDPRETSLVKPGRLRRLFGELRPYLSGQYNFERTGAWREAAAEKTLNMIPLFKALHLMRAGQMDGHQFAALMRRPGLRASVKALAETENNFLHWQRKLEKLDELAEEHHNKASKQRRGEINVEQYLIAQEFLATIGVRFDEIEVDGKMCADPASPLVPDWDFDAMSLALRHRAESLKRMPERPIDLDQVAERWAGAVVSQETCRTCVHSKPQWFCTLGRPVQWLEDEAWEATDECDAFKRLSAPLLKVMQPTENRIMVGSVPAAVPVFIGTFG